MSFLTSLYIYQIEERRLDNIRRIRQLNLERRNLRDTSNPFEISDNFFRQLYRVNKPLALNLIHELEPILMRVRSHGLSVQIQVLATLRFYAEGSYQKGVGQDFYNALSQSSVSRCVNSTSKAIVERLFKKYITFPSTVAERQRISNRFTTRAGFPGILGCIDCTHIAIVTPSDHPEAYKNHHGYFSLNTQLISDADLNIINMNARFPGSVHDQFIFTNSIIRDEMQRLADNRIGNFFLLGDSGYTAEKYMLLPILDAEPNTPEYRYTQTHCSVRNVVERLNGVLKAKFRCLRKDRVLHYTPETAGLIAMSCATLHNMMQVYRIPNPEPENQDSPMPSNAVLHERGASQQTGRLAEARRIRQAIIQQYFS